VEVRPQVNPEFVNYTPASIMLPADGRQHLRGPIPEQAAEGDVGEFESLL